jgi:hypothetical protein
MSVVAQWMKGCWIRGGLCCLCGVVSAWAGPASSSAALIDATHRTFSNHVEGLGEHIDHGLCRALFFEGLDDPLGIQDERRTYIILSPYALMKGGDSPDFGARFSMHLRLPRFEDRVQLTFDNLGEENAVLPVDRTMISTTAEARRREEEEAQTAGVEVDLVEERPFKIKANAGLRVQSGLDPKLRLRILRPMVWGNHFGYAEQSVFFRNDSGFGERTRFVWNVPFGSQSVLRQSSSLVWEEKVSGVSFGESFVLARQFTDQTLGGFRAEIDGSTEPSVAFDQANVSAFIRFNLGREWCAVEIEPGWEFIMRDGREDAPFLLFKFHIGLGDVPDLVRIRCCP